MKLLQFINRPSVRARIVGVLCALLLVAANQAVAYAADGSMSDAIANLAKMLIDGIIALAAILLAVGIAAGVVLLGHEQDDRAVRQVILADPPLVDQAVKSFLDFGRARVKLVKKEDIRSLPRNHIGWTSGQRVHARY